MMLCDLTDAEAALLYEGSDPEARVNFNIIKMNRFYKLIGSLEDQKFDGAEVFKYVENRLKAANNG